MTSCLYCQSSREVQQEKNNPGKVFCNVECQSYYYHLVAGKNKREEVESSEPMTMESFLVSIGPLDTAHFAYLKNGTDTYDLEAWNAAAKTADVVLFRSPGGLTNPTEETLERHLQFMRNYVEALLKRAGVSLDRFDLKMMNQSIQLKMVQKRKRSQRKPNKMAAFTQDDYVQYVYDLLYHDDEIPPFFSETILQDARARYQEMIEKFLAYANTGKVEHIESMMNNGFNPNARGKTGWTALALAMNHPNVVRVLLADPQTDRNAQTPDGKTALEIYALYSLRLEAFSMLYADRDTDTSSIGEFIQQRVPQPRKEQLLALIQK